MIFDVVIGNPPFNSGDTQRNYTKHRGQGKNMSKLFTLKALGIARDYILFVQPYGQRTYSSALALKYLSKGLIKIIKCSNHFPDISQRLGYFIFDLHNPVNKVQDAFESSLDIPEKNISQLFRNQPGKLSRFEYENNLKSSGAVKVIITTSVIKYTDDLNFHEIMGDTSYGHWRVVFNCTTSLTTIGKVVIASPQDVLSKSVHCLVVSSEEEAKKYAAYLKEKTTEKVLASVKVGMCNSKKFIQYIPLLIMHDSSGINKKK